MKEKTDALVNLILEVAQEQLICNLPASKVLIFVGENETHKTKAEYNFKVIGGEKNPDDEEEGEDEQDEQEEHEWIKYNHKYNYIETDINTKRLISNNFKIFK